MESLSSFFPFSPPVERRCGASFRCCVAAPVASAISPNPPPLLPPMLLFPPVVARIVRRKDFHLDSLIDAQKRLKTVDEVRAILTKQRPLRREMSVEELAKYSRRTGLRGCRQCLAFLKRYPLVFHLFFLSSKDEEEGGEEGAAAFFRLTEAAETQLLEEESVLETLQPTLLEKLRRLVMMSAQKQVLIKKIECISEDLGFPDGFLRVSFLESFPGWFKVVETGMGPALELVNPPSPPLPPVVSAWEEKRQGFEVTETGMAPADVAWDPPLTASAWEEEEERRFEVSETVMGPSDTARDPPAPPAMMSAWEEKKRFEAAETGMGPADVACGPPAPPVTSAWEEEKQRFKVTETGMGPADVAQDPPTPLAMMSAWEDQGIEVTEIGMDHVDMARNPPTLPAMSAWKERRRFKVAETVTGPANMAQESPVSPTASAWEEKQRFKLPETGMGPADMAQDPPPPLATSAWEEKQEEPISRPIANSNNNRVPTFRKINLPKGLAIPKKERERIARFEDLPYISPYCNSPSLSRGIEAEKRTCAVVHELLSLTMAKRMRMDHLAHFRSDFRFPQRLRAMVLRHPELFYISLKGDRNSVFLREAYDRAHLIQKDPLTLAREKWEKLVLAGTGRVAGRRRIEDKEDLDSSSSSSEEGDAETYASNKQGSDRDDDCSGEEGSWLLYFLMRKKGTAKFLSTTI